MSKEVNKVPATQTAPQKPRPKFGVRVSKDVPKFEVADQVFTTRMISITEELALVTYSEEMAPKAEDGDEAGSPTTSNESLGDSVAGVLLLLLKPRLKKQAESEEPFELTEAWVKDNMRSSDLGGLLYLLRTGHEQPDDQELASEEEAADPNADQ